MPIRSGLIVVLRLFAIFILFQVASYMLALAATAGMQSDTPVLPQVAAVSLLLVPFLVMFWFAAPIVDLLAPKASEQRPEGPVTLADLQAIAFSVAGALILYAALSQTIGLVAAWHFASQSPGTPSIPASQLLQGALAWLVGIYLLVGGPGLRQFLTRIRTAGPRHD